MSQNATSNALSAPLDATSPLDILSLISSLLSISALREWLKLGIMGGVFEICRRFYSSFIQTLRDFFWLSVTFDEDDDCYEWIMFWLSRHPSWSKSRRVEVTSWSFGLLSDDSDDDEDRMSFIPSTNATYSMWYHGHYMVVCRSIVQISSSFRTKESLTIDILSRDQAVLMQLLLEAKSVYKKAKEKFISVHVSDVSNNWRLMTTRPKRPLTSIILEPGVKELLLNDAQEFLESREWYSERGIPFRRGYLLHGAPGSGKTSMIQSIAGELGLDIYIITLSRSNLDDNGLNELISDLPQKCIALMEDIDVATKRGISRDLPPGPGEQQAHDDKQNKKSSEEDATSRITLSGLLNALDGIGAQEGRILFATTNDYSALDPALCRPGRMDLHIEFKLASKDQAEALFNCFYLPSHARRTDDDTTACFPTATAVEDDTASESSPLLEKSPISQGSSDGAKSDDSCVMLSRPRGTFLSPDTAHTLAIRFADAIPERELSMASLQGYLMTYKSRPHDAVRDAPAWVEKARAERLARATSSSTS
ncbi:P-loop containing nucleoside triphosphate hydrolase protein [Laetiporus sulphureus 93-53]|uniref:p-loop containing nucleoside triphosphate hydrolase protein n=1 Tax=Laetiporus sulphureus 93-53 TaxID=1314785 RepID=A0A165ELE8_9APHY|nr:P-loop containing nucleoside triphosphate hydrolase protein [Laetiporus sulphureus 93-53]KZT07303.1 P-loop containing nucleoside triphosphate hydrolase protein [Laetiporus sulphureus 93-53]